MKDSPLLDLSRYKKGMIAMRWRTLGEFESGKGSEDGICAEIGCNLKAKEGRLEKRRVLFKFREDGETKSVMVGCWVCEMHGKKLDRAYEYEKKMKENLYRDRGEQVVRSHDRNHHQHKGHHDRQRHHSNYSKSHRDSQDREPI